MRLTSYVNRNGPGAKRDIVNAGDDSFTLEDVIDMCGSKRKPLTKWRAVSAALDYLEGKTE